MGGDLQIPVWAVLAFCGFLSTVLVVAGWAFREVYARNRQDIEAKAVHEGKAPDRRHEICAVHDLIEKERADLKCEVRDGLKELRTDIKEGLGRVYELFETHRREHVEMSQRKIGDK